VSQGVITNSEISANQTSFAGLQGNNTYALAHSWNFGQRPFSYTPPTGFKALNTLNLPTPTILKGNQYFDATTYAGTGAARSVTNAGGFQPDLVWIKNRAFAFNHVLQDSVRGAGTGKKLSSNVTSNEGDTTALNDSFGYVSSFDPSGFSLAISGTGANDWAQVNGNVSTYVGWQWKANGTPAVTNTAGSITSQVSVGGTQGFSIVSFVNASGTNQATVGHGLGVAPRLIIAKNRDTSANNWAVFHASVCDTTSKFLRLNTTDAVVTFSTVWGAALPTSTVFGVTGGGIAAASVNMIAYCFSEVAGFSRIGSYTGNGSADGPFVFCGFRPRWVMIKNISNGTADAGWIVIDSARSDYNQAILYLAPNTSGAEASSTGVAIDFTSNGFKIRNVSTAMNANTNTMIFAAFAEVPFKNSLAR
jgi:hypothetical protein